MRNLVSELKKITLSVAQLLHLGLQLRHEVVLMLRNLLNDGDLLMPRRALLDVDSLGHGITGLNLLVAGLVHSELSTDLTTVALGAHGRSGAGKTLVDVSLMKSAVMLEGMRMLSLCLVVGLVESAVVHVGRRRSRISRHPVFS